MNDMTPASPTPAAKPKPRPRPQVMKLTEAAAARVTELTQRADSGWWLYPVGWADVGYSASEIAMKEVIEETGIECEPVRLIAVLDGLRLGFARVPMYSIVFLCRMTGGELRGHPLETSAVGFFGRDALPQPLAGAHRWLDIAFKAVDGEELPAWYDEPRRPVWRAE